METTIWGFPKIMGTSLGVPIIRIIVYWALFWGPLILGNYHLGLLAKECIPATLRNASPGLGFHCQGG